MPDHQDPWLRFHTNDADEAHAHLGAVYMEHSVPRFRASEHFTLDTSFTPLGATFLGKAAYTAASHLRTVSFDDPTFILLEGGTYRASRPGDECDAEIGGSLLLTPCARLDLTVDHCSFTSVTVSHELIEQAAEASVGRAVERVRFESGYAWSKIREQQWISTVAYVQRSILTDPVMRVNEMIVGQAQRLLATMALNAYPNSARAQEPTLRPKANYGTVRRAMAYIEAHLADDLSVNEIARSVRVDVLSLQEAFRTHLGTTPLAYLRRVRLDLAHRELQTADPRTPGVIDLVARSWGFANPRRFAAEYLRAYGRPPSETLRS